MALHLQFLIRHPSHSFILFLCFILTVYHYSPVLHVERFNGRVHMCCCFRRPPLGRRLLFDSMASILRVRGGLLRPVLAYQRIARSASSSSSNHAEANSPRPPRTADDSTSALAYKQQQRSRPPPLPATDIVRERSAEEAVTNILYNTPPPSLQPYKKCVT